MYACINVLTKLMYFQQILYLLGVNKCYGYGVLRYMFCQVSASSTVLLSMIIFIEVLIKNIPPTSEYISVFGEYN